ncbi:ECF transporter S component [Schnuerera sp.]|uniref:ECF transporter S component n=1 Tax=Schnuerera sp. TaxID=2794844 RepID=UPI002B7BB7C7|nr:ECF transporter S component [Schnuerera sp.]HSH35298.1 ECF transporter S component [Schnuerera sp.]
MEKVKKNLSIKRMAIVGILGAISIVLGMTPLGFIPVGPTRATIMHIPVIIGAIMEGPLVGGLIGLIFGLFSIFQAATNPTPVSFVFLNPIVSVLPRVLIGVITHYVYKFIKDLGDKRSLWILNIIWIGAIGYLVYGAYINIIDYKSIWPILINAVLIILTILIGIYVNKKLKNKAIDIIVATIMGTLTNTVGVLFAIYILFGEQFVEGLGQSVDMARKVIIGIGVANGIPEIIIAIIVVTNVVTGLKSRSK